MRTAVGRRGGGGRRRRRRRRVGGESAGLTGAASAAKPRTLRLPLAALRAYFTLGAAGAGRGWRRRRRFSPPPPPGAPSSRPPPRRRRRFPWIGGSIRLFSRGARPPRLRLRALRRGGSIDLRERLRGSGGAAPSTPPGPCSRGCSVARVSRLAAAPAASAFAAALATACPPRRSPRPAALRVRAAVVALRQRRRARRDARPGRGAVPAVDARPRRAALARPAAAGCRLDPAPPTPTTPPARGRAWLWRGRTRRAWATTGAAGCARAAGLALVVVVVAVVWVCPRGCARRRRRRRVAAGGGSGERTAPRRRRRRKPPSPFAAFGRCGGAADSARTSSAGPCRGATPRRRWPSRPAARLRDRTSPSRVELARPSPRRLLLRRRLGNRPRGHLHFQPALGGG